MRKSVLTLAALSVFAGVAHADVVKGTIGSINSIHGTLTVDGVNYFAVEDDAASDLAGPLVGYLPGDEVTIRYTDTAAGRQVQFLSAGSAASQTTVISAIDGNTAVLSNGQSVSFGARDRDSGNQERLVGFKAGDEVRVTYKNNRAVDLESIVDNKAAGAIVALNKFANEVTLDNGATYKIDEVSDDDDSRSQLRGYRVGDRVELNLRGNGSSYAATSISAL